MKIQFISYDKTNIQSTYNITRSTLQEPQALDLFEINIFSLQDERIWRNQGEKQNQLDCTKDFMSIKQMIGTSQKAVNIIALPQNYLHRWLYYSRDYHEQCLLKDEISVLQKVLLSAIIPEKYIKQFDLIYENSVTKVNNSTFESAFCFLTKNNMITKSVGSDKATTLAFDNLMLTTLNLKSPESTFEDFIKGIGLEKSKKEYPQWLINYNCFDDERQQETIDSSNQKIQELNEKINQSRLKLEENLKFKSILSTNGDELVEVVFEILEKLLACDLSGFIDEKKQDFLIKKDSITFIGEIKGITSNVKSENVSQLDVHYHSYLDDLRENNIAENVKQLLIINPFRTKPLAERDAVHEIQINLAKRNGSLIITTETLLKIFEKFLNNDVTSEKIISVFSTRIGLLPIEAFYEEKEKVDNSAYQMRP